VRTLSFYGSSDDLVEVDDSCGKLGEEYSAGHTHKEDGAPAGTGGRFLVTGPDGGRLVVIVSYARHKATWDVAVAPVDEDVPLPAWPARFKLAERGYSVRLELELPDGPATCDLLEGR
jgi:hypothetical protein